MIKKGTFEDFATQEIIGEKELPKTLEEFAIKEIQNLREEIQVLVGRQGKLLEINNNLCDERDEWKNKYYELVNKLKEDLKPEINVAYSGDKYIKIDTNKLWQDYPESYEYYKNIFNLKDECEENEPEEETIKN